MPTFTSVWWMKSMPAPCAGDTRGSAIVDGRQADVLPKSGGAARRSGRPITPAAAKRQLVQLEACMAQLAEAGQQFAADLAREVEATAAQLRVVIAAASEGTVA